VTRGMIREAAPGASRAEIGVMMLRPEQEG
jgi:hypothetical protein